MDAIVGMLLVLGAYTILQTINPATLDLRLPEIKQIARTGLSTVRDTVRTHGACAKDSDCNASRGEKCMRWQVNQTGFDATADAQGLQGACSDGGEGGRCRCGGTGCQLTSAIAAVVEAAGTAPSGFSARTRETNNAGSGAIACQTGLQCIFAATDAMGGWFCQHADMIESSELKTRVAAAHTRDGSRTCSRDSDCRSGEACIRTDVDHGRTSGECSSASNATEGQRCRCRGYGCGAFAGVASRIARCGSELVCRVHTFGSPDGLSTDWYCSPSDTSSERSTCYANCDSLCAGDVRRTENCRRQCDTGFGVSSCP